MLISSPIHDIFYNNQKISKYFVDCIFYKNSYKIFNFIFFHIQMAQQNTALVLIGLQELWRDKNSDYRLRNMSWLIDRACYLIQYAREMGYKIIFIRHTEKEWPFADKDPLSQIIADLCPQPEDIIIKKRKISSFFNTDLAQHLEWIKNIVFAWIPTNLCVRMFAEEAYDREFNLALIEDICQTYNEKLQDFTLDDLNESRPDLDVVRLETFLW